MKAKFSTIWISLGMVVLFIPLILTLTYSPREGAITPNDEFFVISIGSSPEINVTTWSLEITGEILRPQNFTYSEILELNSTTAVAELQCVDGPSDTALWEGVRLKELLNSVGLTENATDIVFLGADGYNSSLTVEEAMSDSVLLAYGMNNESLPVNQGFPLRIVAPGLYGYKWVKWIERIEVVEFDNLGYWESRGWLDNATMDIVGDSLTHAYLFSGGFLFAGLSFLSGLVLNNSEKFEPNITKWFGKKAHWITSIAFLLSSLGIYIYWNILTYQKKGFLINTFHGIVALSAMISMGVAAVTGLRLMNGKGYKKIHTDWGKGAFWVFLGAIIVGLLVLYKVGPF